MQMFVCVCVCVYSISLYLCLGLCMLATRPVHLCNHGLVVVESIGGVLWLNVCVHAVECVSYTCVHCPVK